jgi:hypothetical protein
MKALGTARSRWVFCSNHGARCGDWHTAMRSGSRAACRSCWGLRAQHRGLLVVDRRCSQLRELMLAPIYRSPAGRSTPTPPLSLPLFTRRSGPWALVSERSCDRRPAVRARRRRSSPTAAPKSHHRRLRLADMAVGSEVSRRHAALKPLLRHHPLLLADPSLPSVEHRGVFRALQIEQYCS